MSIVVGLGLLSSNVVLAVPKNITKKEEVAALVDQMAKKLSADFGTFVDNALKSVTEAEKALAAGNNAALIKHVNDAKAQLFNHEQSLEDLLS